MKLYNRQLQQIENKAREERINKIVKKAIDFLVENYGLSREELQEKIQNLAIVERNSMESHFVEYNGQKEEIHEGNEAASFVTHKKQEYDGDKWNFENAVYTSDTNENHTILHELFHYLSAKEQMTFDKNGVGYDKTGTAIQGYNREDKLIDDSLNARGINEGITEMLANQVDKKSTASSKYAYQVCITDILVSTKNDSLIKAYFSQDERKLKEFFIEFDKRQSTITSKDLCDVTPSSNFDTFNKEIFKGCLEYTLSFCQNKEDFLKEKQRLLPIIKDISSFNYKDSKGTLDFLTGVLVKKEQLLSEEQQSKEDTKEIIEDEKRKKFVDRFIKAYNDTEEQYQYDARLQFEKSNMQRVQEIIETEGKDKTLMADLEGEMIGTAKDENFKIKYTEEQVSAMARLLKGAELLTKNKKVNPKGRDYLKEFTTIPNIEYKLKQMQKDLKDESSYMYELRQKARDNRANGTLPDFPTTPAEIDASDTFWERGQGLKQEHGQRNTSTENENEKKMSSKRKIFENPVLQSEEENQQMNANKRKMFEKQVDTKNEEEKYKKKIENLRVSIKKEKVAKSDTNTKMDEINKRNELKRLNLRIQLGAILTAEEQQRRDMLEQEFKSKQKAKKKQQSQMQGHGMGR